MNEALVNVPEGLDIWRMITVSSTLKIEMQAKGDCWGTTVRQKETRSQLLKTVNQTFGVHLTRFEDAYEFMCQVVDYMTGEREGLPAIDANSV